MENEITCSFCGDPIEGIAIEGPTGATICLDCINILIEIVTQKVIEQQVNHSQLH